MCDVSADTTDYKISYDIIEFHVTGDEVQIKGWSALSHMDNYGGLGGNMVTKIIAYVGGEEVKSWSKSSKYKKYDTEPWGGDGVSYDLYHVRCEYSGTDDACGYQRYKLINNAIENNQEKLKTNSCTKEGKVVGQHLYGSHCAYHNLGFKTSIKLNKIIKDLNITKSMEIKFAIQTQVWYGKYKNQILTKKYNDARYPYMQDSADIGIVIDKSKHASSSCTVFGNPCTEGKLEKKVVTLPGTNQTFVRKITVRGMSEKVKFTANNAEKFSNNRTDIRSYNPGHFVPNKDYEVLEIGKRANYSAHGCATVNGVLKCNQVNNLRKYKLKEGNSYSWAFGFWTKASGGISLKLDPISPPDEPSICETNEFCVGSNCKYNNKNCPTKTKNLSTAKCKSKSIEGCTAETYKLNTDEECSKKVVSSVYYFKVSDVEFKNKYKFGSYVLSASVGNIDHRDGYYYFPVKILANVSYGQTAMLKINDGKGFSNNQTIVSGANFAYSYQYTVNSRWNYKKYNLNINRVDGVTEGDNTIEKISLRIKKKGERTTKSATIYISLSENDELFAKEGNVYVSKGKYNMTFLRNALTKGAQSNGSSSIDMSANQVVFGDTNDASKKQNTSDAGTFSCSSPISTDNWGAGVSRSSTCTYKIKKAFFSNQMNGNIKYSDESVSGYYVDPNNKDGSKSWYYIPANLKTGDTFEFYVNNTNLSLIRGVKFTYNAICSVKGKNEIHDSNKIKYRSIDTSNSFPKATKISDYPKNWQQYVKDKGLNRIISNSFSGISYQTKSFKNKTYIDSLKSMYGDYYSYNDMDTNGNGTSAIIHKNEKNLFSKINGYHNKAGEYKEEKDKVQS